MPLSCVPSGPKVLVWDLPPEPQVSWGSHTGSGASGINCGSSEPLP